MTKGTTLQATWGSFEQKLKKGAVILLMGTADAIPTGPTEKIVFAEDLSDGQESIQK